MRAFGLSSIEALPTTAEEIQEMFKRIDNVGQQKTEELEQIGIFEDQAETEVADMPQLEDQIETEEAYSDEPSAEDDVIFDN